MNNNKEMQIASCIDPEGVYTGIFSKVDGSLLRHENYEGQKVIIGYNIKSYPFPFRNGNKGAILNSRVLQTMDEANYFMAQLTQRSGCYYRIVEVHGYGSEITPVENVSLPVMDEKQQQIIF